MASRAVNLDDLPEFLGSVLALLTEDASEAALQKGLRLLTATAGAEAAAHLLTDRGQVVSEAWHPDDLATQSRLRLEFHRLALAAGADGAGAAPHASLAVAGSVCRAFPLACNERVLGAVCLASPAGAAGPERDDFTAHVVQLLAYKTAALRQVSSLRAIRSQYERWFKRLDDQLRVLDRERQKFATVVNQTDTYVFVTDPARTIRWTNKAMGQLAGTPGGDLNWIGKTCREVCSRLSEGSPSQTCEECPVTHALEQNEVGHRELSRSISGVVRNLYLTALPIKGPEGRTQEVMVMIQDLTDLEIVRRSESRYRLVFERSSNAIVMAEPSSHRIVLANAMASRMTGYGPEELLALSLEKLHPAGEWPRLRERYAASILEDGLAHSECLILTRGGRERITNFSALRFALEGREVIMVEFRDITERKRAEEALHKAEERLHTVVANLPVVLFALDRNGVFTLSEGKGLEALGLKPGQVVGQSAYAVYRDVAQIMDNVRRALSGEPFTSVVQVGELVFETRYTPMRDAGGGVVGLIGVAADVTEQKRLEDQLRHAQKLEAVGRLAGGVAHDFNNLLTAIIGHSELMLRVPLHASARRYVEEIRKAGARGSLLTHQLLAFSRKEVVVSKVLDLRDVVVEMQDMLQRLIGEDIELATVTGESPAPIKMDPGQIEQVIMNLAINARDAMPQGGRLTIEVEALAPARGRADEPPAPAPRPYVMLKVMDNGRGMDAETKSRIFEPFFTTKTPGKGTGLGLSIVYGIVLQSGGDIEIASEPGCGATVTIYLPRAEAEAAVHEILPSRPVASRGSETILLVEDDEAVRPVVREILEINGYEVLEAENGVEALRVAARHHGPIHLVLSDVVMPQMSGGEMVQRLLNVRPEARVLYTSGNTEDDIVRHGVTRAGVAFIPKPFTLDAMTRKVREVLDGAVAPDAVRRGEDPPRQQAPPQAA